MELRRLLAAFLLAAPALPLQAGDAAAGGGVFATYCQRCHGSQGAGDGPAAAALAPHVQVANLRRSTLSPAEQERIIRNGGAGVGRSSSMPPWGEQLSDAEIADLLALLSQMSDAGSSR